MTNGIFRIGFHRLGVLLCLLSIIAQLTISPHPSFAQEKGVTGCAASLYSVDGQHTQPVGTGFLGRSTQPGPHGAVSNSYAATTLQQVLQGNDPVSLEDTPTQILIVDDFDAPSRAMSHGHDVFDVAQSLLNGLGGGTIQIKEVNAGQGYDLPTLIDKTLTAIQQGSDTFKRFVVNMSFIIVACEATVPVADQKFEFKYADFYNNYLGKAGKDPSYSLVQFIADQLISQKIDSDPKQATKDAETVRDQLIVQNFHDDLARLASDKRITIVAAAGNTAGQGPFMPAAWPEAIAVSASAGNPSASTSGVLADFSSKGEVIAPGSSYELTNPIGNYVDGTSFSAPAVSVLIAGMESVSKIQCDFSLYMQNKTDEKAAADVLANACH